MNFENKGFLNLLYERKDTKTVNMALEYMRYYGIDHHSRAINDLLPEMMELPNFVKYLESRMQVTDVTSDIQRGEIVGNGIVPSTLEINKGIIKKKLFNRKAKIE